MKIGKSEAVLGATTTLVLVVLVWTLSSCGPQEGMLIVLSLTLIAVIWYTYFTYQLAVKKEPAGVAATIHYEPQSREVYVIAHNPTNRYLGARLWIEAEVYGQMADLGDDYSGKTIWHLTPRFEIRGHFALDKPLSQFGKNFAKMMAEATPENRTRQLRLSLRATWEDEEGQKGSYPAPHRWYFDFPRNTFVYQVGPF